MFPVVFRDHPCSWYSINVWYSWFLTAKDKYLVSLNNAQTALIDSYEGNNTLNLMSSIERRISGSSPLPACSILDQHDLDEPEHLILLVLDGLGDHLLQRYANPDGPLIQYREGQLHSVFPSTTSAAISTIMTARAPADHGILAWYIHLNQCRDIYTTLMGSYRNRSTQPLPQAHELFHSQPLFRLVRQHCQIVHPQDLISSEFTLRHAANAKITGVQNLQQLFECLQQSVQQKGRSYTYAYWPSLDSIGHKSGAGSFHWLESLREIEHGLTTFIDNSDSKRYRLLVTADHGMINVEDRITPFEDMKDLASCLETPLAGEPRSIFCNVKTEHLEQFDTLCTERYARQLRCVDTAKLFSTGLFGPRVDGTDVPESIIARAGNRVLLLKEKLAWTDTLAHESPAQSIGVHGGLHSEEVEVPLIII